MKRFRVAGVLIALVVCAVAGPRIYTQLWARAASMYADLVYGPEDPRSTQYIRWKRGLNGNLKPDVYMAAFYLDGDRDQLTKGATEDQLKSRFGYVRRLEQVSPYYQQCRDQSPTRKEKTVVFLRDTPWMVVMNDQRGSELVLCKGY